MFVVWHVVKFGAIEGQKGFLFGNESAVELQLANFQALRPAHSSHCVASMIQRDCNVTANCYVEWKIDFALRSMIESEIKKLLKLESKPLARAYLILS